MSTPDASDTQSSASQGDAPRKIGRRQRPYATDAERKIHLTRLLTSSVSSLARLSYLTSTEYFLYVLSSSNEEQFAWSPGLEVNGHRLFPENSIELAKQSIVAHEKNVAELINEIKEYLSAEPHEKSAIISRIHGLRPQGARHELFRLMLDTVEPNR